MSPLDEMLSDLRRLGDPDAIAEAVAKKAAPKINEAISTSLAAGRAPDGAYANAPAHIETKAYGNLVRTTLDGPEVYGHFGNSRLPQRRMLPDAGAEMPPSVEAALTKAADELFAEWTR